jgi:hypothetical protein
MKAGANFVNSVNPLKFIPPLDPGFVPAVVFNREYVKAAKRSGRAVPLVIGLERDNKLLSRFETVVKAEADADTFFYVERLVKFLLWARGGWKLYVGGPKAVGEMICKTYSPHGARKFDAGMMTLAYGKNFQVVVTAAEKVPGEKENQKAVG